MSYDYSENILVQESAGHLLERELGWEVAYAYNTEQVGRGSINHGKPMDINSGQRLLSTQIDKFRNGSVLCQ